MARAKRTDRTEARRRHRAAQAPVTEDAGTGAAGTAARASAPAAESQRPSITTAFRAAYRPAHVMDDLRALPRVATHWGVLASTAVAIASSAVFIASTSALGASLDFSLSDPMAGQQIGTVGNLSYLAVSLFVAPPPAAGAFLVGFTAPRASWLSGLIYGLIAAVCYSVVLLSPAGRLLTSGNPPEAYIANAWALSPVGSLLFAAAAAWYKRFLNLANPNRGARKPTKPPQGRGNARPNSRAASGR